MSPTHLGSWSVRLPSRVTRRPAASSTASLAHSGAMQHAAEASDVSFLAQVLPAPYGSETARSSASYPSACYADNGSAVKPP